MSVRYARMSQQELYDQVWSEAATKVAARYSLSDVSLRKVCAKYRVPVPPRAYWAKVEAGRNVRRIALPTVKDEVEIVIRIESKNEVTDSRLAIFEPAIEAEKAFPPLVVGPVLERPHPVAKALGKALTSEPHDYGVVRSTVLDAFLVRASPTSADRVLRIADALAKVCIERDFELRTGKAGANYGSQLAVTKLEEDAAAWRRAKAIRVSAAARATAGDPESDANLRAWLTCAADQADRIDPLRPNPPSVVDMSEAELQPISVWSFALK